jgi:hypothetical protein
MLANGSLLRSRPGAQGVPNCAAGHLAWGLHDGSFGHSVVGKFIERFTDEDCKST